MVNDLQLKQAFAYGASIAFQEAGLEKRAADAMAIKMAEGPAEIGKLRALLQKVFGGAQSAGGAVKGVGQKAWGGMKGVGQSIGEGAQELATPVGQAFGSTRGMPYAKHVQTQRLRNMGLMGAGAGAGLGVGGTLGTQALIDALGNQEE
jgi:hypothetical protein